MKKNDLWVKIRNFGNYLHNYKVLEEGEGQLIVAYRPQSHGDPSQYQPCVDCLAFYSRSEFYRHKCPLNKQEGEESTCQEKNTSSRHRVKEGRLLLPPPKSCRAGDTVHRVVSSLRVDDVSQCIKGDKLICTFAMKLCFQART